MLRGAITVFMSGFSVMVIELVAGRLVAPFFGQSTRTWAALTGVTLAGVTLGNAFGGLLARRGSLKRKLVAVLFVGGLLAAVLPHVLPYVYGLGLVGFVVVGWLPLTFVLGCVTPLVAAMCVRSEKNGRDLGVLYFFSMIGSAVGSMLGGLVLPFVFPADSLYLIFGCILLLVAGLSAIGRPVVSPASEHKASVRNGRMQLASSAVLFLSVFAVGWYGMGVELAGARLVTPILGGNHLVWALIFITYIGGMGVGGYFGGWLADRFSRLEIVVYSLLALSALGVLTAFVEIDFLPAKLQLACPVVRLLSFTLFAQLPLALVLGAVSTVLLRFATKPYLESGQKSIVGFMYATSSLGCVLGTFVTGFYCVGRINSVAIITWLSLGLVACAALLMRQLDSKWQHVHLVAVAAVAFVLLCALPFARAQIPGEVKYDKGLKLIACKESQYNVVTVSEHVNDPGIRTIWLDRIPHTTSYIGDREMLSAFYTWLLDTVVETATTGKERSLFMIGGGGYALPRKWTKNGALTWRRLVVAEIDGVVQDMARRYLDADPIQTNGVEYVTDDGRRVVEKLLAEGGRGTFDIVIGDTISDTAIPYHLVTKEFNDEVKSLLTPKGAYLLHVLDVLDDPALLATLIKTLRESFKYVGLLSAQMVSDVRQSFVIVASNDEDMTDMKKYAKELARKYPQSYPRGIEGAEVAKIAENPRAIVLTDRFAPVERFVWQIVMSTLDKRSIKDAEDALAAVKTDRERALSIIEVALKRNPELGEVINALKTYLDYYPDDERAIQMLKEQAERKSIGFIAQSAYASFLAESGKYEDAACWLENLVVRFPERRDFLKGWFVNAAKASKAENCRRWLECNRSSLTEQEYELLNAFIAPR